MLGGGVEPEPEEGFFAAEVGAGVGAADGFLAAVVGAGLGAEEGCIAAAVGAELGNAEGGGEGEGEESECPSETIQSFAKVWSK